MAERPFDALTAHEIAGARVLLGIRDATQEKDHDLNEHEIVLLGVIREGESVGEIQRREATVLANISYPLAKLERHGYITVKSDPRDRRRRMLSVTPKGKSLLTEITPIASALYLKHIGGVKP